MLSVSPHPGRVPRVVPTRYGSRAHIVEVARLIDLRIEHGIGNP